METSRQEICQQYRDASNLNARSAIYRYATTQGPPWPRWVFDQFVGELPGDAMILELGCGDGALWKQNRDRTPAGWRVVLCDLSHGMLDATRELGMARVRTDAAMLPLVDRSFDAVIANHVLYHVDDRTAALAGIARVLKPGGKLYAATNSDAHLSSIRDLFERFLGSRSPLVGAMPFGLENGEAQLHPHFDRIEIRRVGGELRITDADVVVRYFMSCNESRELIAGERFEELNGLVRRRVAVEGAFVCHTATGMFVATARAVRA